MKRINPKMFFGILVTALVLVAMMAPAQAATWDSTMVYFATTVTKYDVAVGNKLKGAGDDTVRILTTQNASPFNVLLATDRSTALPMVWVTENVYTNTVAMRGCAIGDVDNDGQNEIIVGTTSSPYGLKMIKWVSGAWVMTVVLTSTSSYVGAIYDIAIGDADNNSGTPNDIIFNNSSYGAMKARWNGATFDTTRILYNTSNSTYYGVAIGDFDLTYAGNEIAVVSYGQRVYRIKWNGASYDTATIFYTATDYDYYDVAIGDFDASNPGGEIAINNGYNYASGGAVQEVYGSGSTWAMRNLGYNPSNWSSSGEIAVGDFYSSNPGAEIVAVSGGGSAYEARLVYGSGTTWFNEKIMGTGGSTYGVAVGDLNRYRPGNEIAVGGNYKVWEAEQKLLSLDMAAISVDNVPAMIDAGATVTVKATVKNFAEYNANYPIPVKFSITGPGGYTYSDVDQATTINLPPAGTEQIIFSPNWTCPATLGNYTIKAWTELAGDQIPANDTFTFVVTAIRPGGLNEMFTGATFPPAGWTVYNFDGGDPWIRYTVYYHSAPACAQIYYDVPNNDWLITPRLRVVSGDIFSFWWRTHSTSYSESLLVRVSTNPNVADTGAYLVIGSVALTGNISWFNKQIDMSSYAGQDVYVAFWYQCNNNYGMGIDDVTGPYFPPQIKVTPDSVYAEGYVDSFFDVFFNVANIGGGTLNYTSTLSHPASFISIIPSSGSLGLGMSETDTLRFNTTGLAGHYYDSLVITSNSGAKATNIIPIHLYVRLVPNIALSPDSFYVGVEANGTANDAIYVNNTGNGELNYAVETFESGKFGDVYKSSPSSGRHRVELTDSDIRPGKDWIDPRKGTPPTEGQGGPDAFGYKWKDSDEAGGPTFSWVEINAIGTLVTSSDDNNSGPYPIGFPFEFYGNTFTDFRICSNGFISFTSTVNTLTNDTIPSPPEPNNLLALYWDDLYPYTSGTGKIYYYYDGSKMIIEYDHVIRYGQATCPYTMEAILYPNGTIVYQYLQMGDGTCTYLNQATVGIENATGTDGLEVVFNANYIHDNMAIKFSAAPAWLVFSPEIGVAPAFGADTVDVTFDATGILGGNFYGGFVVTSDDPDTPVDTIPAHMEVLAPNMTFSPDSIMTTATEGQAPFDVTVDVGNSGNGKLTYHITEGIPWLALSPASDTVLVGDPASTVTLTIKPTNLYAGHYHGELKVYSNDPNKQPYATYQVYLSVGPYPDIATTPDSFYVGIYAGYTKDTTLKITNTGDGHLAWGVAIEELGRKGADTTLYEGFEGTFPPAGWTVINNDGGANTWVQYTTAHTGTYSAACRWESSTLWNDDWLITPRITIGSNDSISFWYQAYSTSFPESLEVRLSTTTADPSAFTHLLWAGSQLINTTWAEQKVELAKFSRGKVYIAFVYKGLDEFRIMVDDISVLSYAGPWLAVDPVSGVTEPHTTTNVGVHFSSSGIENDMYANLWITSNDPDESPILVPVHMAILGPNYSVSPPETLVIDALEGTTTDGHVFMQNFGGHAPLAYKITDPVAWLSETPDTTEVPIDGSQDVTVTVDGNLLIAGDYTTKLFISSNDFSTPKDTLVVIVHVGPAPDISVSPESLRVVVPGGSTSHATLTINNDGDGHLAFDISTEETGPKAAASINIKDRFADILQSHSLVAMTQNNIPADQNNLAQLTGSGFGNELQSAPGTQLKAAGDTVFVQLPHDPTDTWSMGTTDVGAGYKLYENFWGVTLPIKGIQIWGLCLKYSGGWLAGNPNNLAFDITFYSDPPDDPTLPPNQLVCSYDDVVPPVIVNTGLLFSGYSLYMFGGMELNPLCNLEEGWVAIQSNSAGTGGDWLLWASAKTGDVFSYHEGGTNPRLYDQAILMTGGANWLVVSPDADTVNPHASTNVDVLFDATNILGGDKYGNIVIGSNDPDENPVTVRAHMIVAGANYAVHPLELHIDALEGQITPASLVVSNPGGIGVLSFKMTWAAPWLTAIPDTADVPPDGSQNITVRIDGNQLIAGDYYTEIMVKTNAANQQLDTIPVYVHVGPDPDIDMSASSLRVGLNPGCDKDVALRVNNLGSGHLSFSTEIESGKAEFVSVITKKDQQLNQVFGRNAQSKVSLPSAGTQIGRNGDVAPQLAPSSSGAGLHKSNFTKGDVLLSEGFEGAWLPTGWTQIINNTGYQGTNACTWSQMSTYYHSGAYSAGLWWDYYYQDEWLISPSFIAGAACTLSFWTYGYEGSTYGDHYYVMVTTDDGAHWTPVFDMSALTGAAWNYYAYPYYVDISAYAGQTVKLAWYAQDPTTNDGIWYAWLVDDILVTSSGPPPPTCPFTVAPESDTLAPTSFEDLILSFDPGMFEDCSEDTITCNLIITSNDPDEQIITIPVSSWLGRGDMFTPSCVIDIGDVVFLVNYILKNGPAPNPVCLGDMAQPHDGMVDVADLIYLMQYLYMMGSPPQATPAVTPTPIQR